MACCIRFLCSFEGLETHGLLIAQYDISIGRDLGLNAWTCKMSLNRTCFGLTASFDRNGSGLVVCRSHGHLSFRSRQLFLFTKENGTSFLVVRGVPPRVLDLLPTARTPGTFSSSVSSSGQLAPRLHLLSL